MNNLFLIYCNKWKKFWKGKSPIHHHQSFFNFFNNFYNQAILFVSYYFILTPVSLLFKLSGKSFLKLKLNNNKTYWQSKKNKINYEKLY